MSTIASAPKAADVLVQLKSVSKTFDVSAPWLNRVIERKPQSFLHAVSEVSFDIKRGETLALVGESGCGKSTVARLAVGLYETSTGQVIIDGHDMRASNQGTDAARAMRRKVQMIFQDPYASLNPRWRVADIVAEPIRTHKLIPEGAVLDKRVNELLGLVKLTAKDGEKYPHQFSGGQRQRIAIARAIVNNPSVIIADEPTGNLDPETSWGIMQLLDEINFRGTTIVMATHNRDIVNKMRKRVLAIENGNIVRDQVRGEYGYEF